MADSNHDTFFSNQRTAIPFGKYEAGSDDVFPCNETMVGREGARAKLIDFLINAGTRKAILVTGRRGMGKTSFVQYCLREYEDSRVERYWRSNFGRTFESLLWLLVIISLCASVFVMGGRILEIFLDQDDFAENRLFWMPIIALVICFFYPIVIARKIFTAFLQPLPASHVVGAILAIGFFIGFALMPITSSAKFNFGIDYPTVTLSRLIVIISAIYCAGELIDSFSIFAIKIPFIQARGGGIILTATG
jgi:hypothetical protein